MKKALLGILPAFLIALLAIPALIISIYALIQALNVDSGQIKDGEVSEIDLKDELTSAILFPDGQKLATTIFTNDNRDGEEGAVLGATTDEGFWRVIVEDDALVVKPTPGSITGELIADENIASEDVKNNSLTTDDILPAIVSSIAGVTNDGGNIDLIGGENIQVSSNDSTNQIILSILDGAGSGLDADTLDGKDSFFFQNADNIIFGTLHTDRFSAYDDLGAEGKLDFNDPGDVVTKGQADSAYVNVTGDTMTGDLIMDGAGIQIINGGDLFVDGETTLIGQLDAQGGITNTTTNGLELYDDQFISLDSQANLITADFVNVIASGLANVIASETNVIIGNENFISGDTRFDEDVWLGDGNGDRVVIPGPISSGDADPLTIEDNSGLIITRRDDPSIELFSVDGSGLATFYGNAVPATDLGYDLGAPGQRWDELFVQDIYADCFTTPSGSTYCDNADIVGTLNVDGDTTLNANIDLGDGAADTVTVNGRVDSDIIPLTNDTFSLGAAALRWQDIFASNRVLVGAAGLQTVVRDNGLRTIGNTMRLVTSGGFDILLNPDSGVVRSDANINPQLDDTYNLGSNTRRWANLFAVNISGDCFTSTGGSTYCDDASIKGNLDVAGLTTLNDTLTANGLATFNDNSIFNQNVQLGNANSDLIDIRGTIQNTSGSFGGRVMIDDVLIVSQSVGSGNLNQFRVADDQGFLVETGGGVDLFSISGGGDVDAGVLTINNSAGNGAEAGPVASIYEVSIVGDLEVTGTIDPTAILFDPMTDGQTVIQVNDSAAGTPNFTVDENGNVVANDIDIEGDLLIDGETTFEGETTFNSDVLINAQLSVNDLIVSNSATFSGSISSDLEPTSTNTFRLGSGTFRWQNVFARRGNFSQDVQVGSLVLGGNDLQTTLDTISGDITALETDMSAAQAAITVLQGDVANLDTRVNALEARRQVTGGFVACVGNATNTVPVVCFIDVGAATDSIVATPVGTGNNLKAGILSYSAGNTSATVEIFGEAGGSAVTGVTWTAVLQ